MNNYSNKRKISDIDAEICENKAKRVLLEHNKKILKFEERENIKIQKQLDKIQQKQYILSRNHRLSIMLKQLSVSRKQRITRQKQKLGLDIDIKPNTVKQTHISNIKSEYIPHIHKYPTRLNTSNIPKISYCEEDIPEIDYDTTEYTHNNFKTYRNIPELLDTDIPDINTQNISDEPYNNLSINFNISIDKLSIFFDKSIQINN
jgi:hypothetical protein